MITTTIVSQTYLFPSGPPASFAIPFGYQAETQILAVLYETGFSDISLVQGTDFSVSAPSEAGGTLTRLSTWDSRYTNLVIYRVTPKVNETSLVDGGAQSAATMEQMIDLLVQMIQEGTPPGAILKGPVTDPPGLNYTIPKVANRALQALIFDASGNVTAGAIPTTGMVLNPAWASALSGADLSLLASVSGGGANYRPVVILDNLAALRLYFPSVGANISALLRGYTTAGDKAGGPLRRWVSGASVGTYVDNGDSIVVPTGGDGSAAWIWASQPAPALLDTVATDLKAWNPGVGPSLSVQCRGYFSVADGGGGKLRRWVFGAAPGTYVDNGGTTLVPTGGDGSGAWLMIVSGPNEDKWFGTKYDGTTDDSAALNAAVGASYGCGTLLITGLNYKTTAAITVAAPIKIQGTIAAPWNTNGTIFNTTGNIDTFQVKGNNVEICGIEFVSGYNAIHLDAALADRIGLWVHDCSFKEVTHYAIWVDGTTNDIIGKVIIERNLFYPSTATPTAFIEVTSVAGNVTALVIDNNVFEYRATRMVEILSTSTGNVDIDSIRANYFEALVATTSDVIYAAATGSGTITWHCAIRDCTFNCDNTTLNAVNIVTNSTGVQEKPGLNHCNVQNATVRTGTTGGTGEIMAFSVTDCMLFGSPIVCAGARNMGVIIAFNYLGGNITLTNITSATINSNVHVSITIAETGGMDAFNVTNTVPRYSAMTLSISWDPSTPATITGNPKFTTFNANTANITSGTTSVTVTHGLAATPPASKVHVTPITSLASAARFWVDTVGATTFKINVDINPGTTISFAWMAQI